MSTENIHHYYNKIAKVYDQDRFQNTYGSYLHQQEDAFLKQKLKGEKILSLACGTGRFMEYAQIGLDISEEMLQVAQEKYPDKRFTFSPAKETNFEEKSFDSIFSFHLFMHLETSETKLIFGEAHRILKEKGQFIFDFPSAKRRNLFKRKRNNWHAGTSYSIKEMQKIIGDEWNLSYYSGTIFIPIHRFRKKIRKFFIKLDTLLCKSFLREYSSHLIVIFEKK